MNALDKREKIMGSKKRAVTSVSCADNIYSLEVSKMLLNGNVTDPLIFCDKTHKYFINGGDFNCRDSRTGESFLHVICKSIHYYTEPTTVFVFYMLGTKIDTDLQDHLGDTVLHKVCLIPGAWRCIVALMRCNASPLIKNKLGFTPEELILHHKKQGWEENLYWLKKFSPGLLAAVSVENPDVSLVEKLLKNWCRTTKVLSSTESICVKSCCPAFRVDLVRVFEKYTNTIEFALSLLSGKIHIFDEIMKSDKFSLVDVNTRDHSYQYQYKHYPMAPRPLLAALWETEQYDMVKTYLMSKPDTSVKYSFEAEASSSPKPLFFHLVNPKLRPRSDAITALILAEVDLSIRDEKGQTILFEAIFNDASQVVIKAILDCGVNIAARDNTGKTARDHCIDLQKLDYKETIDNFVRKLITDQDVKSLESLVLQMYDGIPDNQIQISSLCNSTESHQHNTCLLENIQSTQETIKRLFSFVEVGDFLSFSQLVSPKLVSARDKAGRGILHYAVQHNTSENWQNTSNGCYPKSLNGHNKLVNHDNNSKGIVIRCCESGEETHFVETDQGFLGIINFLVEKHPHLAAFKNNLGQTPLHCAHIYCANQEAFSILEKAGDYSLVEDVFGFIAKDYNRNLAGQQTFEVRRKSTIEMDLDIFLNETEFEKHLLNAIESGDMTKITPLIEPLLEFGGEPCFNHILFDCLDAKRVDMATYLVLKGFNPNISKQYDRCNPENPMCAMMECSHSMTTLRQRAEESEAFDLITLIDQGLRVSTYL